MVDVGDNAKIADIFLLGHGHVLENRMGLAAVFRVEPVSISKIRAEVYLLLGETLQLLVGGNGQGAEKKQIERNFLFAYFSIAWIIGRNFY